MPDNRMYKINNAVYQCTRQLPVKQQRGKLYVNYKNNQINLNDIAIPMQPVEETDCVCNYIFGDNGFTRYPCPAMDYWIYRHRLGHRISVKDYKIKFGIKRK